ncbi:hemolysin family protein [Blastochloris sulfoviridis]|uniref:HlyC/CorC family transporter n=1 Tax=Blastochloris sulfoviridis TaxID=50712 RepID=A0A5M6HJ75_9HYPH|nr:hemolysin family protein [Blastochloris sulfoviridis]KAA5595916.1 HlyC/CorC family transporter [Blastochloris sulfoviridis]
MLIIELGFVVALIVLNGLLAMSELAVVSSRPARLRMMAERGVAGAERALLLAADPGKFLSTVQIGITLVGVLSGAFSGATIGLRLTDALAELGVPRGVADALGVGIVVALITYGSLIIGELVPKQLALSNPEAMAARVAPAMNILARISSPVVALLDMSGKAVLRLLGHDSEIVERITEEEIKSLIAEAETAGVLEPGERQMIAAVMRLGDRPVRAVMTPRTEVDMIDLRDDIDTIRADIVASAHSRLPVHDGSPDGVLGVIQAKDLVDAYLAGKPLDLRALIREAPVIPDTADALAVVEMLGQTPLHIGLVHDEYGHFQGVVTNADILESIVGSLQSEAGGGPAEPDVVRREDGSYLISGTMPIDELSDLIGLPLPDSRDYHTLAGFLLDRFGHLPGVGEHVDANGWRFEVVDLDGRRIDKAMVSRVPKRHRAA